MIGEAAKTLLSLKRTLDELMERAVDPDTAHRRLRNYARVNGLEWTQRSDQAATRFMEAVTVFTAGGNAMKFQLMTEDEHQANYEAAVDALRGYRDALRGARISDVHRAIASCDECEVDEPDF